MSASLLWYDLETFGIHPLADRIAQFAAIRTDDKFNEVESPHIAYCQLSMDYLPNPESCLITRLTPEMANERGWGPNDAANPDWAQGTLQYVDGHQRRHSLIMAFAGEPGKSEIRRRIWRAQVAVLFPFLEEQRVVLLDQLRPMLRPATSSAVGSELRDIQELELGQILFQVRSRVDRDVSKRLQTLV